MTEENRKRLEELGWQDVEKRMPPLGVDVNVCQADDYTQAIWSQKFTSEAEVRSSNITHWSERRKI